MINVIGVSKKYGKKLVLDNISMTFPERKINFLMGKNGSGKTTFIKCLTDLEKYEGKIEIDGEAFLHKKAETLVLWDDCPFYENLSGIDNLIIFGEGKYCASEIVTIVNEFLDEELLNKKVKAYSYGQKKKLGLAMAVILSPTYIIMDEISNGLDYDTLVLLKKLIIKWTEEKTIILTGHQFGFYNDMVDNVYVNTPNGSLVSYMDIKSKEITLEEIYNETMH